MCQVIPFTLPCCRRTYVGVTKLPSCPDNWPKSKCPPELCIQICYEADDRETGTCWRCRAEQANVPSEHRERLRPGIDSAGVIIGLEELGPRGRKNIVEEGGHCWFCGAKADCETCEVEKGWGFRSEKLKLAKKRLGASVAGKGKLVNKRLKIEDGGCRPRFTTPAVSNTRNDAHVQAQVPRMPDSHIGVSAVAHGRNFGCQYGNTPSQHLSVSQLVHRQRQQGQIHQPYAIDPSLDDIVQVSFPKSEQEQDFNHCQDSIEYPSLTNPGQQSTQLLQLKNNYNRSEDMDDSLLGQMLDGYNNDPGNNQQDPQHRRESHPGQTYSYPSPNQR